ncbi:MAG: MOSC domain-containing protein [Gammaproteobacteria bacterium]|jgi:MOSC domain-containing protein YiiM
MHTAPSPRLLSIQVGQPQDHDTPNPADGKPAHWRSGFMKTTVAGAVWLGETGLEGDGQADLKVHGGPHKAVNVYPWEHFSAWRRELGCGEVAAGAFGENFTVAGLLETGVCIGDRFRVGAALVEVTQARQPCWKLARSWGVPDMVARVRRSGRSGWYFRTLEAGYVQAGDMLELVVRPWPQWNVTRAARIVQDAHADPALTADLAACGALSPSWRERLLARVGR